MLEYYVYVVVFRYHYAYYIILVVSTYTPIGKDSPRSEN